MKQTIEIDFPDGYEISSTRYGTETSSTDPVICLCLKRKQQKDFAFFVDQYMHTSPTTNDEVVNWLDNDQIEKLANHLKQSKFEFVPWEIKIGLLKFICVAKGLMVAPVLYDIISDSRSYSDTDKIIRIIPFKLVDSLKQNKN